MATADRGEVTETLALYRRRSGLIYRLALSITGDPGLAEDVVQEAFCRLHARLAGLAHDNLEGYLYRCARNLALDALGKAGPLAGLEAGLLVAPVERALDPDLVLRLNRALGELPFEQREVVVLRIYEGYTFPRIAELLGAPEGTLHSRFRYAMQRLRRALQGADA